MKNIFFLSLFTSLLFQACVWSEDDVVNDSFIGGSPESVMGLKPVYTDANWQDIYRTDPLPIQTLGKIYYKAPYIYVNELYQGIHIIDNSSPVNPTPVHFIKIPGNKDIAIKGNILYADNVSDLVAIDLTNFLQPEVKSRVSNIYDPSNFLDYPENYFGYFECVDPDKGAVMGWEEAELSYPECWR